MGLLYVNLPGGLEVGWMKADGFCRIARNDVLNLWWTKVVYGAGPNLLFHHATGQRIFVLDTPGSEVLTLALPFLTFACLRLWSLPIHWVPKGPRGYDCREAWDERVRKLTPDARGFIRHFRRYLKPGSYPKPLEPGPGGMPTYAGVLLDPPVGVTGK